MSALVRSHSAIDAWSFDRPAVLALGRQHRAAYRDAQPYPHVVIDGLLGDALSSTLAAAFPDPAHPGWKRRDYAEQAGRLGQLQRSGFDGVAPALRFLLGELTGMTFLDFLGALTGRDDLIADPRFLGAGLLATLSGGHLGLHADFNRDSIRLLDRVLSVFYYLPRAWDDTWGGALELWNRERTHCAVRIAPRRDRLVVMAHGDDHWHGHPAALACPPDQFRAVVAAYYYAAPPSVVPDAAGASGETRAHGAIWTKPDRSR
jgi:hypothetical protein